MRRSICLALGLWAVGLCAHVRGDDWPQFRGPGGAGVSSEKALPLEWSADKNVQWKVKIPGIGWSSPIVWGDKVFVTSAYTENQKKPRAGGGFGGGGGMPPPGQILPSFLHDILNLTAEQKKQLDELQKETESKIAKVLTAEQAKQLKEPRMGPSGPGGFGGGRPGAGMGGPPQVGQIMPAFQRDALKLTDDQKKQIDELQKEVDGKLAKLLTDEQNKQIKDMRQAFGGGRPPGGGRPGGPGGFGGGRPPDAVYRWQLFCLDRATGNILWSQVALEAKPRIPTQESNTYATETPVTDGERVYAYFGMHGLFCYDIAGQQVWKKDLGSFPMMMGFGTASSPVLEGGRLFVQVDNEEKSFLVALDAKTGDELWREPRTERTNWGSPIIWKNKQQTELVTPGSQKVSSYDPATGKLLWELRVGGGQCCASPVGDEDRLFVGTSAMGGMGGGMGGGPGGGAGGRPGGPGPGGGGPGGFGGSGSLFAVAAGASGDITPKQGESKSAGVLWSLAKAGPSKSSPLVYQGYVYILENTGGMVNCYDAATGKPAYSKERIPRARAFWASPLAYDGKIFCLDDGGTTHILQAGLEFKVLGTNKLDEMFWASPAVAGGALFLRGVDSVYCIKAQ